MSQKRVHSAPIEENLEVVEERRFKEEENKVCMRLGAIIFPFA